MVDFVVAIPSRFESTRLPGKPLIDLNGKPMIQHVVERALDSQASCVVVATDDERIAETVTRLGVVAVMTASEHQSGTDRIWEAVSTLEMDDSSIVVNVQGDEPLLPSRCIRQAAELVAAQSDCGVATLFEAMRSAHEIFDSNTVKVVADVRGYALYFSRAPIPWERGKFNQGQISGDASAWRRHLGIYAFRRWALERFVTLPQSKLEFLESLEQLRLLENGIPIAITRSEVDIPAGVDTAADVERVRAYLKRESAR